MMQIFIPKGSETSAVLPLTFLLGREVLRGASENPLGSKRSPPFLTGGSNLFTSYLNSMRRPSDSFIFQYNETILVSSCGSITNILPTSICQSCRDGLVDVILNPCVLAQHHLSSLMQNRYCILLKPHPLRFCLILDFLFYLH